MLRVIICGYSGGVGKILRECVAKDSECELVAGVSRSLETGTCDGDVKLFKSFDDCDVEADAIIDFSHPDNLDSMLKYVLKTKTPVVIATTGFTAEQDAAIEDVSKEVPVLLSHNTSVGVNVLIELVKQAAKLLDFDIEIVEKHHNRKEDAPSGTSKMLISAIQDVLPDVKGVFGRSGRSCKRQPGDIGVSSVRGGNIVSDHDVLFCGDSEVVTLAHHAQSNAIFAEGAIFAAKKILDKENGLYDMKDIL